MIPLSFTLVILALVAVLYMTFGSSSKDESKIWAFWGMLLLTALIAFAAGTQYPAYWSEPAPKLYIVDEFVTNINGDPERIDMIMNPLDNAVLWDEGVYGRPDKTTRMAFFNVTKEDQRVFKPGTLVTLDEKGMIIPFDMVLKNYYVEKIRQKESLAYGEGWNDCFIKWDLMKQENNNNSGS